MAKESVSVRNTIAPKRLTKQMGSMEKFRRMATVIQDSNDAITFQDLEGNILAWNRGAEIIYGYSQAEALSMNIVDTVPKEYQEEALGFLASLKRGELLPNLETKRKHKDGRIIDVWLTNTKLTDDKGKLTGIATTERDITERNQSEVSLREKLRELDYLRAGQIALSESMRGEQIISRLGQSILSHLVPFTNSQIGAFYLVTDERKLQLVSGHALSKDDLEAKSFEFGEGLVGQVAFEKRSLLIEDVPPTYFHKVNSALGSMIPRSLLISPILYENEVRGVIELGSLYPFSEHQRAFLSHVSENIGIAINTSAVRKKVQIFLEESQTLNEKLQSQKEELRATNEELEEQSLALKESKAQLESQTQELREQKETLNEKNDALNKAQVLLEEKASEVQRASQYKTEFLANMSHELRTPLNSSLILAKLLMNNDKGNLIDEQIQFANSIYSSGNDLLNLINDILDLSKVEAGKLDVRIEDVSIPKVIDGLKQTFETLAKDKKLSFEVKNDTELPPTMQTDRQRLDQILKNLISNALKFTSKGSVQVRVYRHSKGKIAFRVSDSGIGIPKVQQAIIFEAFRQADGTTNRKYGGTGLGLSISRDLAKLLGGSIEVDSESGIGSHFTLILPEVNAEAHMSQDHMGKTHAVQLDLTRLKEKQAISSIVVMPAIENEFAGFKLLIVDDDIRNIFALTSALEQKGATIVIARNGHEALLKLQDEKHINLVLMDIMMPGMDGYEATIKIREQKQFVNLPIIAVTAKAMKDDRDKCLEAGMNDYISKPIDLDELNSLIRIWLPRITPAQKILSVGKSV